MRSTITNQGRELLSRLQLGEIEIEFSSAKTGSGTYTSSEAIAGRTDLKNEKNSYSFSSTAKKDDGFLLSSIFSNVDPVSGESIVLGEYRINEIGVYVTVDGGDEEYLYIIAVCNGHTGNIMPAYDGSNPTEFVERFMIHMSTDLNISVNYEGAAALAEDVAGKGDNLVYDTETDILSLRSGDNTISSVSIETGNIIKVADVSGATATTSATNIVLKWSDPSDTTASGGVVLAEWKGTKVVRKVGSAPTSISDGTLVCDNTTRNQYASTGFSDDSLEYNTTYYYRFFPYTKDNVYTTGSSVSATPERVVVAAVPTQSGTLTYDGTTQAAAFSGFISAQLEVTGNTGKNADTYTATFTPKEGYIWWDGTFAGKTATWTIDRATLQVPAQSGTLTYNGTEQTASWDSNYDGTLMTVSGNKATNAGSHAASFSLIDSDNYQWTGPTTSDRAVLWEIGKAAGSFTLSADTVSLNQSNLSQAISATVVGDGALTATTSDASVATTSVSGRTITINNVDQTNGSATITVSLEASTNYTGASSQTISVTAKFTTIYGAQWDGTSTTAWSRTDASQDFTSPVPAVNNGNGSSPFDTCLPWSGMQKSTRAGGVMVSIPKFYYKITQVGSGIKIQIADGPADGFSVSPAHMNRGDGNGERDMVYVGRYHCANSDYKSKTGEQPKTDITRSTARSAIHNLGSNIWQFDIATRFTLWLLYIVEFANWDSQKKIGRGCSPSGSKANMGGTDGMTYHTGTSAADRDTYGWTQYRWIESLWDNVYDWMDGCYYNSGGLNIILNPNNFSDSENGISIGTPSNGYPSAFTVKNVSGTFQAFIPTAASGSDSTYSCDYWGFSASYPCLFVGGYYNQGLNHGLFFVYYYGASNSGAYLGCRLQELP